MKTNTIIAICISVLLSGICFADEQLKGQIVGNLDNKVKILLGDKAFVNLGQNEGIIKGDIYNLYSKSDVKFIDSVGRCAVTEVYEFKSVCEVIKMKREIGTDVAVLDKLYYNDNNLFPVIFKALTKTVEPYEPYKEITVYVHSIIDENNNITKFSEKLQKEIKKVFYQKKRIKPAGKDISKALFAYFPSEYEESKQVMEDVMKKDNIDVMIAGEYKIKGDKILISLYKIDRNYDDIIVDTSVSSKAYSDVTSNVIAAYSPVRKEKNVSFDVVYKPIYYKTIARDERSDIIDTETKNNPFFEYNLKRIDFNIISPVEFKLKVDNNEINFEKMNEYKMMLPTGRHEITATFKKGYFLNDILYLTNDKAITKSMILSIDKPDDLVVEVEAYPLPGKEKIEFKVYKKVEKSKPVIRPILQRETVKQVETFKD